MKLETGDLLELLSKVVDKGEVKRKDVGKTSEVLRARHKKIKRDSSRLQDDLELRHSQLEMQIRRQIEDEFSDRVEEAHKVKREFWESVYQELGLDPDKHYSYDSSTGTVSVVLDEDDDDLENKPSSDFLQ